MRFRHQTIPLVGILACFLLAQCCLAEDDAIATAVAALQHGDYSTAEQILRSHLKSQPKDGAAFGVLGVVLDQEKKYSEADEIYRRALADSPVSPALLNNYGNHLVATDKPAAARKAFLQVIGMDPGNANALVQLARLSLENKNAAEALTYLDRISKQGPERPDAIMLRLQADFKLGREQEGDALLARISAAGMDSRQRFQLGIALASVGQYEKAETLFTKTLEAVPANFELLYDLGLAASHAGHNERARHVLGEALAQQPENVDVLYDLAAVDVALNDKESALALLVKAAKIAPQRRDVLQLEARTSAALGYFADATQAWDDYLRLVPDDEAARRERAFAQTAIGEKMTDGLAELTAFVRKHPNDAVGHYELGTAQTSHSPDEALRELNRALALNPGLTGAHVARGLLLYRQGNQEDALADFAFAAQKEPNNGPILDRLGQTYLALGRTEEALKVLRKAAGLMPSNSTVLLHLGRALSNAGQPEEAAAVFARCRELGPNHAESPHPEGLVEFLGLSAEEQRARYRAGVEHTVKNYPDNAEAQVRYLRILLEDGNTGPASAVVDALCKLNLSSSLLTEAAGALLGSGQYSLAKQLLDKKIDAIKSNASPELVLDQAIANAHLVSAQAGVDLLNQIPPSQREGDYYLARAEMLETQNRPSEAEDSIQEAIRANPTRPDLYSQAALLLIQEKQLSRATNLLAQARRTIPNNPELRLLQALALELGGQQANSDRELKDIENRWPEWDKVWIAHALVLEARHQSTEADAMRQAAVALGAPAPLLQLGKTSSDLASSLPLLFNEQSSR